MSTPNVEKRIQPPTMAIPRPTAPICSTPNPQRNWIQDAVRCLWDQHVHAVCTADFGCRVAVFRLVRPDLIAKMNRAAVPNQANALGAVDSGRRRPCGLRVQPVDKLWPLLFAHANHIETAIEWIRPRRKPQARPDEFEVQNFEDCEFVVDHLAVNFQAHFTCPIPLHSLTQARARLKDRALAMARLQLGDRVSHDANADPLDNKSPSPRPAGVPAIQLAAGCAPPLRDNAFNGSLDSERRRNIVCAAKRNDGQWRSALLHSVSDLHDCSVSARHGDKIGRFCQRQCKPARLARLVAHLMTCVLQMPHESFGVEALRACGRVVNKRDAQWLAIRMAPPPANGLPGLEFRTGCASL